MDKGNTSSKNKILVAIGGLVVLLIAAIVAILLNVILPKEEGK